MNNIKNKKMFGKIAITLVFMVVILGILVITPFIVKKLKATAFSIDDLGNAEKNGVVLTTKIVTFNEAENYNFYNGAKESIKITGTITCGNINNLSFDENGEMLFDCEDKTENNFDNPITVNSGDEYDLKYKDETGMAIFKYILNNKSYIIYSMNSASERTSTNPNSEDYNIPLGFKKINNLNNAQGKFPIKQADSNGNLIYSNYYWMGSGYINNNSGRFSIFTLTGEKNDLAQAYVNESSNFISMDVSEDIKDMNLNNSDTKFRFLIFADEDEDENFRIYHPLSSKSINMNSDFLNYFNYSSDETYYDKNSPSGIKYFYLNGIPKASGYTMQKVYLGLYGEIDTKVNDEIVTLSPTNGLTVSTGEGLVDVPFITLTTYDKSKLGDDIDKYIKFYLNMTSEDMSTKDAYIFSNLLDRAIDLYNNRYVYDYYKENYDLNTDGEWVENVLVTQSEIDKVVKELEAAASKTYESADYSKLNSILGKINTIRSSWYTENSWNNLQSEISKIPKETLNEHYQPKVDYLTNNITEAYNNLKELPADYSSLNETKKRVPSNLSIYNDSDVSELNNILNKITEGKLASEQSVVDEWNESLSNVINNLSKKPADVTMLNQSITTALTYQNRSNNYSNWNTLQSLLDASNSLEKTIDNQDKIDKLASDIRNATNNLTLKPADYSLLKQLASKIPSNYDSYSSKDVLSIKEVVNEINNLSTNLTIDKQYIINNLCNKVQILLNGLKEIETNENNTELKLKEVLVDGKSIDINNLKIMVPYSSSKVNVSAKGTNNESISITGNNALTTGENKVYITLTKDGKTSTYILLITREKTSDYLSNLEVKDVKNKIVFDKDKTSYKVKVDKDTNSLDLSLIAEDSEATVTIKGNKNLKDGDKVIVEVKDKDGNIRVYTLDVQKPGSVSMWVILSLIFILIIISGVLTVIKEKKQKLKA